MPATSNTPAPTARPPGHAGRKEQLEKIKKAGQDDKDQIAQITKAIAVSQQDIGVLESGLSDIDQTVNAYTQVIKAAGDLRSLKRFIDQEQETATSAVGTGKPDLDNDVEDPDAAIAKQKKKVDDDQAASDKVVQAHA